MAGPSQPIQGGPFRPEGDAGVQGARNALAHLTDEQFQALRDQLRQPAEPLVGRVALVDDQPGADAQGMLQRLRGLAPAVVERLLAEEERFRQGLDEYLERSPEAEGNARRIVVQRARQAWLERAESLDLSGLAVTELPVVLGQLMQLRSLNIDSCSELAALPDSLGNLVQLETLNLDRCRQLRTLPDSLNRLERLQRLMLFLCPAIPTGERLRAVENRLRRPPTQLLLPPQPIRVREDLRAGVRASPEPPRTPGIYPEGPVATPTIPLVGSSELFASESVVSGPAETPGIPPEGWAPTPGFDEGVLVRMPAFDDSGMIAMPDWSPSPQLSSIRLRDHDLINNPRRVLHQLGDFISEHADWGPANWKIELEGVEGLVDAVDMGGVRRDVVYRLVQTLFDRKHPQALHHYGEPPEVLPSSENENLEENAAYRQLGRVLSVSMQFPAPIGALFSTGFFRALSEALNDPALREAVSELQARLGALAYNDTFAERVRELVESDDRALLQVDIDNVIERLEQVDPQLARQAQIFFCERIEGDSMSVEERRALLYLELRHPQLAKLVDRSAASFNVSQLAELTPILERQDLSLLPDLSSRLRQAEDAKREELIKQDEKISERRSQIERMEQQPQEEASDVEALMEQLQRMERRRAQCAAKAVVVQLKPGDVDLKQRILAALVAEFGSRPEVIAELEALRAPETRERILDGLMAWVCNNPVYRTVGNAIQRISEGILEGLEGHPDAAAYTDELCCRQLEGDVSIETLIAACRPPRGGGDPRRLQTYNWLMRWIGESSPEQRRAFCYALTGAGALAPPPNHLLAVQYQEVAADRLPVAHTCNRQLDLPMTYASYEDFQEKLERFLRLVRESGGFGLA